jgi:hypothetical protein
MCLLRILLILAHWADVIGLVLLALIIWVAVTGYAASRFFHSSGDDDDDQNR